MKIKDFVNQLERLGFKDSGFRHPSNSWLRSYDPPAGLKSTITSLNIGSAGRSVGRSYRVSVQGSDYIELGGCFPMLHPDEELLAALKLGGERFISWMNCRQISSGTIGDMQIVGTADGKLYLIPESVN